MKLAKWLHCYFTTGIDWHSNTATNENWQDDDTLGWERCRRTMPLSAAREPITATFFLDKYNRQKQEGQPSFRVRLKPNTLLIISGTDATYTAESQAVTAFGYIRVHSCPCG